MTSLSSLRDKTVEGELRDLAMVKKNSSQAPFAYAISWRDEKVGSRHKIQILTSLFLERAGLSLLFDGSWQSVYVTASVGGAASGKSPGFNEQGRILGIRYVSQRSERRPYRPTDGRTLL